MQDSWAGWRELCPALFWLQCYISLTIELNRSVYRDAPDYVAAPLALLASSVVGLILAGLGAAAFAFLTWKASVTRMTSISRSSLFFFVAPEFRSWASCLAFRSS